MNYSDLIEEMQVADSRDYITEAYSALDPIQELAYENECSREEMVAWINRKRDVKPQIKEEAFDESVPF